MPPVYVCKRRSRMFTLTEITSNILKRPITYGFIHSDLKCIDRYDETELDKTVSSTLIFKTRQMRLFGEVHHKSIAMAVDNMRQGFPVK